MESDLASSFVAVLLPGLFVAYAVYLWRQRVLTLRLEQDGVRTQGTVLRVELHGGDDDDVLDYCFRLKDGTQVHRSYSRPGLGALGVQPGDPLDVVYLKDDPSQNQPVGHGVSGTEVFVTGLMVAFLVLLLGSWALGLPATKPCTPEKPASTESPLKTYVPQSR